MRKIYIKYPVRVFSLALIAVLILSSFSLCSLIIINCEVEEVSCCTITCEEPVPIANGSEDGCCCKITEAPKQLADVIPSAFELSKKYSSYEIYHYSIESSEIAALKLTAFRNYSSHSPPEKDICVLNSNFRI